MSDTKALREQNERMRVALQAWLDWRDGPEGPEALFEEGARALKLTRAALGLP